MILARLGNDVFHNRVKHATVIKTIFNQTNEVGDRFRRFVLKQFNNEFTTVELQFDSGQIIGFSFLLPNLRFLYPVLSEQSAVPKQIFVELLFEFVDRLFGEWVLDELNAEIKVVGFDSRQGKPTVKHDVLLRVEPPDLFQNLVGELHFARVIKFAGDTTGDLDQRQGRVFVFKKPVDRRLFEDNFMF